MATLTGIWRGSAIVLRIDFHPPEVLKDFVQCRVVFSRQDRVEFERTYLIEWENMGLLDYRDFGSVIKSISEIENYTFSISCAGHTSTSEFRIPPSLAFWTRHIEVSVGKDIPSIKRSLDGVCKLTFIFRNQDVATASNPFDANVATIFVAEATEVMKFGEELEFEALRLDKALFELWSNADDTT